MKNRIKRMLAIVCSLALVVSSLTLIPISVVDAADYSGLTYDKEIANNGDTQGTESLKGSKYAVYEGDAVFSVFQYQGVGNADLYIAPASGYSASNLKVALNGTGATINGAGALFSNVASILTYEYNALRITSDGGNATVIIYCPNNSGNGTYDGALEEVTTPPADVEDGKEYIPEESQNSGSLSIPACSSGNPYDQEYKVSNIKVVQDRWYVVHYTVTSSVDKYFQLRLQDSGASYVDWATPTGFWNMLVSAGETKSFAKAIKSSRTTSTAIVDVCMGYIESTRADAATVSITNLSLKEYSSETLAKQVEAELNGSQEGVPAQPQDLALSETSVLTWTASEGATSYTVKIGTTVISESLTETQIDLSSNLAALEYGNYTISVIANNEQGSSDAATLSYVKQDPKPQMNGNPLIELTEDNGQQYVRVAGLDTITKATTYNLYVDGTKKMTVYNGQLISVSEFEAGSHLFQVTGVNDAGESALSTGYNLTIPSEVPVQQGAPTGFTATLIDSDTAVQITWTAPASDCYLYIDGVRYANGVNGQIANQSRVQITTTLNSDTKLTAGDHTFAIATITDDSFGESVKTDAIVLTIPQTAPIEVENLQVTDGIGKLTVTFQESSTAKNAGEKYNIYVDDNATPVKENVSQGEYSIEGLTAGTHTIKVTAKILDNTNGQTSNYIESTGVAQSGTVYELGSPTSVVATGGTNSINITWEDTVTTNVYCIYLDDAAEAAITTEAGSRSAQLTDVSAGTHKITVKAHVLSAYSTGTNVENITVYNPPTKVGTITTTTDYNKFTASWTDTNDTSYTITIKNASDEVVELTSTNSTVDGVITYEYTDVPAGKYTINIVTKNEVGTESEATVKEVTVIDAEDTILTSDDIVIKGFQINLNNQDYGVAFRTVASAPTDTVEAGGTTYTIASYGLIYTFDSNTSGDKLLNNYDATYTILDPAGVTGHSYKYVGKKDPANTFGYIATSKAMVDIATEEGKVSYVATMINMDKQGYEKYANTLFVRAYVVTTDGEIIYGTKTAKTSVAQVADYMYTNSTAKNATGHQFLYDSILHTDYLKDLNNLYYRETEVDYGWNNNLYQPETSK